MTSLQLAACIGVEKIELQCVENVSRPPVVITFTVSVSLQRLGSNLASLLQRIILGSLFVPIFSPSSLAVNPGKQGPCTMEIEAEENSQ